ncbi:MAG TPA: sulfurtransferase [Burkholderiales bacterium]|nr:sulfurtransferase [Burkholderiales bacterium]
MPRIFAAIAALLLSTGAWAAAPAIVDSAFVAEAQKRGAIIWDVRSVTAYKEGHIPGAVNIGDVGTVLRDENTEDYLALPALERILGNGGIDPAKEIVVYGPKGNSFVYFALVTLQNFGARNARIYHGGIEDWKAAGMPVSTETTTLPPVTLKLQPKPGVMVSTPEVVQRLGKPDVQIVDARTPKEYTGDDIRAIRGGHIPGAVNIPYEENWQDPESLKKLAARQTASTAGLALRPREELKALYAKLDPEKETIVYCQSGVRASETATVLKELGFRDVKVYDSSWLGYAAQLDAPADSAKFFNVGLLNSRIAGMQRRIDTLEKQLSETQAQLQQAVSVQAQKPGACINC